MARPRGASTRTRSGRRSPSEDRVAASLTARGAAFEYEKSRLKLTIDRPTSYTPDFRLANGIYIEVKGWFKSEDRAKHLLVKDQHPDLDIRFVFDGAHKRISKDSKTTYASWCDKHGFKWAERDVPDAWIKEQQR